MKKLVLLILLVFIIGCSREKMNEVGVGYNKSLIVPPNNELPKPGSKNEKENSASNDNPLVQSILNETNSSQVDNDIIDQIDEESGYKSDENFFQWLFNNDS